MAKTLLERGLRWHARELPQAAAMTVEIRAGNEVIEEIRAAPGRNDFDQYVVSEFVGSTEVFDWIVAEPELIFGGVKKEPQDGWEVRWIKDDGRVAVFKAMPTTGKRCFDVIGSLGLLYRIHTTLDRIEDAA